MVAATRAARSVGRVLCLGLVLAIASGCTSDAEKVDQYVAEAEAKREEEQYREALILLRQALNLQPNNASINLQIAETLEETGDRAEAGFYYGEAYRLDPTLTDAALRRAPLLYGSEPEEARALVEEVLEREPDNHMAHFRMAEIELLASDTDAALSSALTAAELAPEAAESHRIVGRVYETMAREHRAREGEIDPSLLQKALEAFQRASERSGGAWYHHNDIANLYARWPDHEEEARQTWRKAFAAAQEAEEDRQRAMRSVAVSALDWAGRKGDREFLRWGLERRLEVDPGRIRTWGQLAGLADAQEEGGGEAVWQRALERRPDDPHVHLGYARHLGQSGAPGRAIEYLESLPAELADSPEVDLMLTKGYAARNDLEEARSVVARMRERHPENALTEFAAARLAMAEGRPAEAVQGLRRVADELERADLYRLLAQAEHAAGEPRSALAAANRAIELHQGSNPRRLYRIRHASQVSVGDWQGLVDSLRSMRRQGIPLGMPEMLQLVRASYQLGRTERGRSILEQLLSRGDQPSHAAVLAFAQHEGRRQPDRARKLLLADLERHGLGPRAVQLLVGIELSQGRPEQALEHLARLGDSEPIPPALRLQRARALASLERLDEAEAEARAVFEGSPAPPAAAQLLAEILRARGEREKAIATLEEAREEERLSGRNLWLLGRMHLDGGDLRSARVVLEEAVGAAPNLHVAHNDLAYVLAETGEDLDRALALASQAKSALPESPAVADTLGWVYYKRGMHGAAANEFRVALEAAEGSAEELRANIHYHLALVLREQGRDAEALQALDQALELQPEHPKARDMRAMRAELAAAGDSGAGG